MNLNVAIIKINSFQKGLTNDNLISGIDTRAALIVTFLFLFLILTVPIQRPDRLLIFAIYPILLCQLVGISYLNILKNSLAVLPFVVLIGIFNPIYDKQEVYVTDDLVISEGWLTFISIILRGLLSMQALLILIKANGLINIGNSLNKLGLPKVLCVQIFFLYRYILVLLQEVFTMRNAMISRGYGKKAFPIKLWVNFTGSLFIRSYDRSIRIYQAMVSRGFDGTFHLNGECKWKMKDTLYCFAWLTVFIIIFFCDFSKLYI